MCNEKYKKKRMKQSIGPETYLFPLPAVVVGTYDNEGTPNIMTASWTGVVNSRPSMISVSLRKATYSYNSILETESFTISIPSVKHLVEMDYVGTKSGKKENKFETTGLTPIASELVNAPYVAEFPVVLECKLVKHEDLGLHTMFLGEVVDIKIDENCLLKNGKPDIAAIDPIGYTHGEREYYGTGRFLGKANKLWSTSPLNNSLMSGDNREPAKLIFDYYRMLDEGAELDAFKHFFFWEDFQIINGANSINSFEGYEEWYGGVKQRLFDRKHIINKMHVDHSEGDVHVSLEVYFQARTWEPGAANSVDVKVSGNIQWSLKRDHADGRLKAFKYLVEEKL